jgi:ABC-type spermidine/putrescine transport system permease subunit II
MRKNPVNLAFGAVFIVAITLLYLPILTVGLYAFFPLTKGSIDFQAPTLGYFAELSKNASVLDALANSGLAALLSCVTSLAVATFYAVFLRNRSGTTRMIFEALIYAPFFLPPIIVGLSLLLASSATGMPRGLLTIVVGHSLFTLAVVYRVISVRLANLPPSLLNASADLGASRIQSMRFIVVPHLMSAFLSAGLLAVLLSFDETLITALVAGDTTTLPLRLWAMMRVGFSPSINALVVVVVGICLLLSLAAFAALARSEKPT